MVLVAELLLDLELALVGQPGDAFAKLFCGRVERAGKLDDGAEPRLAPTALEQGDLGPVQIAAEAQLLLRDPLLLARFTQINCETFAWFHSGNSLSVKTEALQP